MRKLGRSTAALAKKAVKTVKSITAPTICFFGFMLGLFHAATIFVGILVAGLLAGGGQHVRAFCPSIPFGQQLSCLVRLRGSEIMQLGAVGLHVVKFPSAVGTPANQFPIT